VPRHPLKNDHINSLIPGDGGHIFAGRSRDNPLQLLFAGQIRRRCFWVSVLTFPPAAIVCPVLNGKWLRRRRPAPRAGRHENYIQAFVIGLALILELMVLELESEMLFGLGHGAMVDRRFRRQERLAAFTEYHHHPSPITKATLNK